MPLTLFRNEDIALASQRDTFFAGREGRERGDRRGEFLLIKWLKAMRWGNSLEEIEQGIDFSGVALLQLELRNDCYGNRQRGEDGDILGGARSAPPKMS
ncbi:MAG: hypothetical protein KME15_03845 [Drouetiella hepatica Uher 2000/2452]|jgi:hypothetical protein|uniref:Uncharacterized protein n=1 Tax=Drouetiella hepatica Uher 2000/2452 TaxID=904376 RepID=A0A951Q7L7_9CYAN|nr:hypothetical protein [Drouetiella hepatica Uher 2000/2452]